MSERATTARHLPWFAAGLAWLLGVALQLQQTALWTAWVYGVLLLGAAMAWGLGTRRRQRGALRTVLLLLAGLAVGFAATGLRAGWYALGALDPALEGRDVLVTGVVEDLPQRSDVGLRFRLRVLQATLHGEAVELPNKLDLGWYAGVYAQGGDSVGLQRQPMPLQPGERWRMVVRTKAPHGGANPHGFDYELLAVGTRRGRYRLCARRACRSCATAPGADLAAAGGSVAPARARGDFCVR
jgi:competence protein ComEC